MRPVRLGKPAMPAKIANIVNTALKMAAPAAYANEQ